MTKHGQIDNERARFLVLVALARRQTLGEIGQPEEIRESIKTSVPLGLNEGDLVAVHLGEGIGADQAGVAFDEVETEGQGQDGDDDHEPVAMFTKNFDHGWAGNLRIRGREPSGFCFVRAPMRLEGRAPSRPL